MTARIQRLDYTVGNVHTCKQPPKALNPMTIEPAGGEDWYNRDNHSPSSEARI